MVYDKTHIKNLPRIWMYVLTILFIISYDKICEYYLYPVWGYSGVEYNEMSVDIYCLYIIVTTIPIFFFNGFTNISSSLSVFVYILGFIPSMNALFTCDPIPAYLFISYLIALEISMIGFFITDKLYFFKSWSILKKRYFNLKRLQIIAVFCILVCMITYSSSLKFVNVFTAGSTLYDLRAEVRGLEVNPIINYLLLWCTNVFLPILLVIYLRKKDYYKIGLVVVGYFIIFMIDKQKITFFLPFLIILTYSLLNRNRTLISKYFYIAFISILIILPNLLIWFSTKSSIVFTLTAFLVMRTLCIGGTHFTLYLHFFEHHPYTYFSHIGIINKIFGAYPYDDSLGNVVSYGNGNSNAIFFIMDGISSYGAIGICIMGLVFIIFKGVINTLSLKYDKRFCLIALIPIISGLLNKSLFTVILSHGVFLFLIILFLGNFPLLKK